MLLYWLPLHPAHTDALNQSTVQGSSHPLPSSIGRIVSLWASLFEFPNPHQIFLSFPRENDQTLQDFLVLSQFS